jgi:hypothetical protein
MRVRFPLGPRTLKSTDAITKADEPTFVGGLRCALVIFTYLLLARPRAARGAPYCSCGYQRHDDGARFRQTILRDAGSCKVARAEQVDGRSGFAGRIAVPLADARLIIERVNRTFEENRRMALRKSCIAPLHAVNDGPGLESWNASAPLAFHFR